MTSTPPVVAPVEEVLDPEDPPVLPDEPTVELVDELDELAAVALPAPVVVEPDELAVLREPVLLVPPVDMDELPVLVLAVEADDPAVLPVVPLLVELETEEAPVLSAPEVLPDVAPAELDSAAPELLGPELPATEPPLVSGPQSISPPASRHLV